jgi:ABC-type polar amino acid transport system ATPase subunit
VIEVANLVKEYGPSRVLDGVSVTIRRGEVTAVVGPSGSGKSTFIRCVNGLETFQGGSVSVDGLTLAPDGKTPKPTLLALRRKAGMVFQQFNLYPHMTAV